MQDTVPAFFVSPGNHIQALPASVASPLLLSRLSLVPPVFVFIAVYIFEIGSCYVTLAGLELSI